MKKKDIKNYFPTSNLPCDTLIQRGAELDAFFYIQIFGGNSPDHIARSREVKQKIAAQETRRPIFLLAEMDICWVESDTGQMILYSYHPTRAKYLHPLSYQDVLQKVKQGRCHYVADLLLEGRDINFFFDLKTGIGSPERALHTLLGLLGEKKKECLFYSYDPLTLAALCSLDASLAMSVRTMKQWKNGRSVLVPRVSALGSLVNVYDLPIAAITINAKLHRLSHLRQLNDEVRRKGRYLIFGTLGKSKKKFQLAYDVGLGGNINKLSFEDIKDFL